MKYTPKYFNDNIPKWKKKKDPILSRIFYRPVSFVISALCAHCRINANTVSYFSALIAIIACFMFLPISFWINLTGAVLVNIWLILDCTDGNIARSVKKQLFGEFADGISSYILVALLCTCMSINVYKSGGCIVSRGNIWIVFAGALASTSDTLMRLIYQKYKAEYDEYVKKGILPKIADKRLDHSQIRSLRVIIETEFGIGGILPFLILMAVIFGFLDIVVIYCSIYYVGSCIATSVIYIKNAIKLSKKNNLL